MKPYTQGLKKTFRKDCQVIFSSQVLVFVDVPLCRSDKIRLLLSRRKE